MEFKLFEEKLEQGKYNELEQLLFYNQSDLISKYQLGVVYSRQDDKMNAAIDIFKKLIQEDFHNVYMYVFLADHSFDYKERINIINCGVSIYPDSEVLNRLQLEITTDRLEAEKIYNMFVKNNCLVNYDHLKLAELFFKEKEYEKALSFLEKINSVEQKNSVNNYIILLKNICNFYLNKNIRLRDIKKFLIGNLKEEMGYLGFYLEIAHYLKNEDYSKVNSLIIDLPYNIFSDLFFEIFSNDGRYPCYFDFEEFFSYINSQLISLNILDKKSINKLESLKLLYSLWYCDGFSNLSKKDIKKHLKILKFELEDNNEDCLIELYFDLLMFDDNEIEAINFIFEKYIYNFRYDSVIDFDNYFFSTSAVILMYDKVMKNHLLSSNNKKEKDFILVLVKLLFSNEMYNKVCSIYEKYNKNIDFNKNGLLFSIAYSYAEIDNDEASEKLYLKILEVEEKNSAVLNNLGIIYEKRGDINKAIEFLEKAESFNHSDTHIRNIKRCNSVLEENKKNLEEVYEGLENIKSENVFIINKFDLFASKKNDSGDVICSYNELPFVLKLNADKAQEVLNTFLRRKYIFKNISHSYDTNKSVYKINDKVETEILKIKENYKLMNDVIERVCNIKLDNMMSMNLNDKFSNIENIDNPDIVYILKRDYYELFIAYIANNQKTVLMLSGSIVETILIYIIKKNNHAISNSRLYDWDLTELLTHCNTNNYISSVPANFINGIKKYRNFVHPGAEIREKRKKIKINDESTHLLWDFVNWLIDYAL